MKLSRSKSLPFLMLAALLLLPGLHQSVLGQGPESQKDKQKDQPMAQTASQPEWLSVQIVRVKPDQLTEWQAFVKSQVNPTLQKGGIKQREAFTTATFGDIYQYVFVTPIKNFAQYDEQSPIVKALGEDGARSFSEKARKFYTNWNTYAVRVRPDLSYVGKSSGPPKLAVVTWISVAPGRGPEFIKTDLLPVMKRAEVPGYLVSQIVFGGDANQYVSLTALDNYAAIDQGPPMMRVLGQQGADKLLQKTAGIVTHVERFVARFVPELSIVPPVQAENK